MDIICIGSTTRDHFLRGNYTSIDWKNTPSHKVIVLPVGEKTEVQEAYTTLGGNAANASVTFARQGFRTGCVAKIGDDMMGKAVREDLEKEHVLTDFLVSTSERSTAFSTILLSEGERTILGYHGASDTFSLSDITYENLKAPWWYLSLAGDSYRMFSELMLFARKEGIRVAFNPSGHHIKSDRESILNALPDIDLLLINEGEAAELLDISFEDPTHVFRELDQKMPGFVAVTNGVEGVMVSDGKKVYRAGIFKEHSLVDRTGAGDAFGAGFVSGLLLEKDVQYAIRLGSANATSVVEKVGATPGILTKEEFESSPRWKALEIHTEQYS